MRYIPFIVIFLSGCSFRPDDGIENGQIVYAKATCEKRIVLHWDSFIGRYKTEDPKGNVHFDETYEVTINKSGCVNWNK